MHYSEATTSKAGLMSAADKSKLDNMSAKGSVFVGGTTKPTNMTNGDIWFKEK